MNKQNFSLCNSPLTLLPSPLPLKGFWAALAINGAIGAAELVGGFLTGSLALIADGAHNVVDCAALGVSIASQYMSQLPPDDRRTFGYKRVEVLAALANGLGLWLVVGVIFREAYLRFGDPRPVLAGPMIALASVGLVGNAASSLLVYSAGRSNINARAAFFHLASDVLSSAAAIASGVVILKTGWLHADAAASVVICVIILGASLWLLKDAVHILLEGAPSHLKLEDVRAALAALDGVREVHDLHLWSLTTGSEAMSGHLVIRAGIEENRVLEAGRAILKEKFGLAHVTLQIERADQ